MNSSFFSLNLKITINMQKTISKNYEQRLFELATKCRSTIGHQYIWDFSERFIDELKGDFEGDYKYFSKEEYQDKEFVHVLIGLIFSSPSRAYEQHLTNNHLKFLEDIIDKQKTLNLYSGFGNLLLTFDNNSTGIEPAKTAVEVSNFLLKLSNSNSKAILHDPVTWETNERYKCIVAVPPFGSKDKREELIARKIISLLDDDGKAYLIVSNAFLWGNTFTETREFLNKNSCVEAIITMPLRSTISENLIILSKNNSKKQTYLSNPPNPEDLNEVAKDYLSWLSGGKCKLGFEALLSEERWEPKFYEPIDFNLGEIDFNYEHKTLGDTSIISFGKIVEDAKITINKTGSSIAWLDETEKISEKNSYFLIPKETINPYYLFLYLSSKTGKEAIKKYTTGSTIPNITAKAMNSIPVIVPDIKKQNEIVAQAIDIKKTALTLELLSKEGKKALSENLYSLEDTTKKFENFSKGAQEEYYKTLPFPIAIVYRKILNAANSTQKFSLMIDLYEVALKYMSLINLADYLSKETSNEKLLNDIPLIKKLDSPSLGDWTGLFRSFVTLKSGESNEPFVKEIKAFPLNKFNKILEDFVVIRNTSLRGHGSTLSDQEMEIKFQEFFPNLEELLSNLSFLSGYTLLRAESMQNDGQMFEVNCKVLMGDNPNFETRIYKLRNALPTKRVLLLDSNNRFLNLDPYIIWELCEQCHRPEALVLDKFRDKKVTYLSYDSGHKPSFETAEKIPLVIREAAKSRRVQGMN